MPAPMRPPVILEMDLDPPAEHDGYTLYDEDFPVERRAHYEVLSSRPLRTPHFAPPHIAQWAFGYSEEWLRKQLRRKDRPLLLDGQPLTFRRLTRGRKGSGAGTERRLTIPDIERLAWALYERGAIDGQRLQTTVVILTLVARQHGVEPREHPPTRNETT